MNPSLSFGDLRLDVDASGSATLFDTVRNERLIVLPHLALLSPNGGASVSSVETIKEGRLDPVLEPLSPPGERGRGEGTPVSTQATDGPLTPNPSPPEGRGEPGVSRHALVVLRGDGFDARLTLQAKNGGLIFGSEIVPHRDLQLGRLDVLPVGTELNLYDVVNYRNRHYTPNTWPELLLGGRGCETDTFSRDWQFAPHPSMVMLRKTETTLCLGALDLPTAFGLYLKASDFKVQELALDYGGLKLAAGIPFYPPRFTLFLDRDRTPNETAGAYAQRIVDEGLIPDPAKKVRYAWHREPLYCTWMDQGFIARDTPAAELGEQQLESDNPTVTACSEAFVHDVLRCMDDEGLRFRTFLLDDGWQVTRGQWEAHPERFPDLRGLVDELHRRGMKVVVWWNWAELFDDAEVDPAHLAGDGWRNPHGRRVRDYSKPETQEGYLKPMFRKLFSSEPNCYDFDGFKTDFLADKIHPDTPLHDPSWRGEENHAYRLFELCYRAMKAYKPDGCHMGCAGHPYLAEFIDINRTYDVATSNPWEHENRAKMLRSLTPGCPVSYDLHNFIERFEDYFEIARTHDASFQIGNVLGMRIDRFSPWEPADARHYDPIRAALSAGESDAGS